MVLFLIFYLACTLFGYLRSGYPQDIYWFANHNGCMFGFDQIIFFFLGGGGGGGGEGGEGGWRFTSTASPNWSFYLIVLARWPDSSHLVLSSESYFFSSSNITHISFFSNVIHPVFLSCHAGYWSSKSSLFANSTAGNVIKSIGTQLHWRHSITLKPLKIRVGGQVSDEL